MYAVTRSPDGPAGISNAGYYTACGKHKGTPTPQGAGRGGGSGGTLTHSSTCVIVFYLKGDICLCISQLGLRIHLFELCSERFITVYFDDGLCIKRFSFFCISHNLINKLIVIRITRLCIIFVLSNLI